MDNKNAVLLMILIVTICGFLGGYYFAKFQIRMECYDWCSQKIRESQCICGIADNLSSDKLGNTTHDI